MKLDGVRGHTSLAVPKVEEADARDSDERPFRALRRVQVIKECLTNPSVHRGEPGHACTGTTGLRRFRDHRDGRVAGARENDVVIVVAF